MKSKHFSMFSISRTAMLAGICLSMACHAADQVWSNTGETADWNTTDLNWDGPAHVAWVQGNNALFGGVGEFVTLTEPISAGGLTFGADAYVITTPISPPPVRPNGSFRGLTPKANS